MTKSPDHNFESPEKRNAFFYVLKELASVIACLSVLLILTYYCLGLHEDFERQLFCNAEKVSLHEGLPHFEQDGKCFRGGQFQSNEHAFSGEYSLKLEGENSFGFDYIHKFARPNQAFKVTVWRYKPSDGSSKGLLVASSVGFWQSGEEVIEKREDGWEKILLKFTPPYSSRNHPLKIYCWNNGEQAIYFDDLYIEIKRKEEL